MAEQGFALFDINLNLITLGSIRHSKAAVRQYAVDTEREYMLEYENLDASDQQIWKRVYRQGGRIRAVTITSQPRGSEAE